MADYVMLEDIFETTENMTVLRNNSYNDDGTDTVAGVEWFKFRETTAANFYVSGNTWIGIGQNSEQLKISRRDADLYTLKREEGTLLSNYKFFLILGIVCCFPIIRTIKNKVNTDKPAYTIISGIILIAMFLISVTYTIKGTYNPFIYFNF